jgi:hypothetical protein
MLFVLEYKAINILISFVGLIISLAIELSYNKGLSFIDGDYFSYILILVQVSALTILFGFIIMLYPTLPIRLKPLKEENSKITYILNKIKSLFNNKLIIIIMLISFILYIKHINSKFLFEYFYTFFNPNLDFKHLNNLSILNTSFLDIEKYNNFNYFQQNTDFLRKLGLSLYTNNNTIIKLIVLTFILLFAIIALFFLVVV